MGRLATAFLLSGVLVGPAAASDYWVDPHGLGGPCDDGASGIVLDEALCTLEGCVLKGLEPGDRCILREGIYATMPDPRADGEPQAPIVFARYGRESAVIAGGTLDLRSRADVRYEGLRFWNVRLLLEGARRISLDECTLEEGAAALPDGVATGTPSRTDSPQSFPATDEPPLVLAGRERTGGGTPAPPVLPIEAGGTGATSAAGARVNLRVPSVDEVMRATGDDWAAGTKTFTGELFARRAHGIRHSAQFDSIAECLADLSGAPGICNVDSFEEEATAFAQTNPAGVGPHGSSSGAKDAMVVDTRGGRLKWLSSAAPPWGSTSTVASEDDVPFVFQVRYHDSMDLMADSNFDGVRDGDSWSCGVDLKTCSGSGRFCVTDADCGGGACGTPSGDEWRTCPSGHFTGGQTVRDPSWWYTGQCNSNSNWNEQRRLCGGQSIFEVRYPQIDDGDGVWEAGEHVNKPAFKVGTHGVGIYFPETQSNDTSGILTVFRSNDSTWWSAGVKNKPFFSVNRDGTYTDGGLYVGNTLSWPYPYNFSQDMHDPFNAWISHDIAAGLPALVVEGPMNHETGFETTPIFSVYSRAGYSGSHRRSPGVNQEVAFEVLANGDIVLGATCPSDADGCVGTMGDSQRIVWRGSDPRDANDTVLHVVDPTARRDVYLPDQSGYVALAGGAGTRLECGTLQMNPPILPGQSSTSLSFAAPAVRGASACVCSTRSALHGDVLLKRCAAPADGALAVELYNLKPGTLDDAQTPTVSLDYCCIAK